MTVWPTVPDVVIDHLYFFLAAALKSAEVGAPLLPTLRIFSPDPSEILLRFA